MWLTLLCWSVSEPTMTPRYTSILEKIMVTHSSILARRIWWTGEPGGLQSMGWQRVRHNWSDLACIPVSCNYFDESSVVTSQKLFRSILILPIFLNNSLVRHVTLVWLLHYSLWKKVKVTQLYPTLRPHGLYTPWNPQGQNTGVGSFSLLQGIFPTQGLNPGLPHCRRILYQLSYQESLYSLHIEEKCALLDFLATVSLLSA